MFALASSCGISFFLIRPHDSLHMLHSFSIIHTECDFISDFASFFMQRHNVDIFDEQKCFIYFNKQELAHVKYMYVKNYSFF